MTDWYVWSGALVVWAVLLLRIVKKIGLPDRGPAVLVTIICFVGGLATSPAMGQDRVLTGAVWIAAGVVPLVVVPWGREVRANDFLGGQGLDDDGHPLPNGGLLNLLGYIPLLLVFGALAWWAWSM